MSIAYFLLFLNLVRRKTVLEILIAAGYSVLIFRIELEFVFLISFLYFRSLLIEALELL
jgi:hypothetical protein